MTVEVTLSAPIIATEVDLGNGQVGTPERDVYLAAPTIIEVLDGIYEFNTLHFHLIRQDEVADWRDSDGGASPEPTPGFEPSLTSARLSAGDRIDGNLVFDLPRSALDEATIVLRSYLLPDGPPAAYWLLR